ncbi:MAG: DNA polymerase III subunit [Thermoguttaceae bacterium]|nr:DNA polymerase III subunit [Thermoguttaceae bacterium]MDW8078273.1 DNA polymerase III subunit [Thermoguttaceae bacterium]
MSWEGLIGHDEWVDRFRQAVKRGRLAHAFLFVGPPGVGKRRFAILLAKSLFCRGPQAANLQPCGSCQNCILVEAGTHPDLLLLAKPEDKSEFPVELLIGDRQHRGQEGACRSLALKPVLASRRILIIDDADFFNPESANALLKTIEEPPPGAVVILIATSLARQLPTIRSRCQIIRFRALPLATVASKLVELGYVDNLPEAERLAEVSGGSIGRAIDLAQTEAVHFRRELIDGLEKLPRSLASLVESTTSFSEKGQSSAESKSRVRLVLEWSATYFADRLRQGSAPASKAPASSTSAQGHSSPWSTSADKLLRALELTLQMGDYVERNVNRACLLQAWLQNLAQLAGQVP